MVGETSGFNLNQFLAQALAGLASGLGTAGQGQGFGPGFAQGQMAWQQQQGDLLRQRMMQQQFDLQRQQIEEQQRRAQAEQAQKETAKRQIAALLGGAPNNGRPGGPGRSAILGGYTPDQSALLQTSAEIDPMGTLGMLTEQAFAKPDAGKWQIITVREGNQDVTYRINPMTGEREKLGAGAAFAPRDASGGSLSIAAPVWGTDQQGNPVLLQMSPTGTAFQTILPPGVTPIRPNVQVDTGTGTAMVSPITGV